MEEHYRHYTKNRVLSKSTPMENGCRLWHGAKNKRGYGLISFSLKKGKRTTTSAHRALYMSVTGILLPFEIQVLHRCDTPACVEFDHLFEGSAKNNMQDCIAKGRRAKKHKKHRRVRVFTDEQIDAMRSTPGRVCQVAEQFGTTPGYISKLRNGKAKTFA